MRRTQQVSAEDRPAKVANIFDVARLARVSHQTVSRVLNDVPGVRPATRQRVEQAIKQLRYTPSPAARALVTRRTRMIGLITPGSADFGPSSIAIHVQRGGAGGAVQRHQRGLGVARRRARSGAWSSRCCASGWRRSS